MPQQYSFPIAETVVNQALAETIGSSQSSLTALQTTGLIRKLDSIVRDFVNAAHIRHSNGGWSWMEDVTNFQTKNATTLNGALTTASTSVVFTADVGFDATNGRIWVRTSKGAIDFIDYTAFATLTATGATDIDIAHATGEKVEKCYALPTTYAKARKLFVNGGEYHYHDSDGNAYGNTYYTRGGFIVLPEGLGAQDATLWFEKKPTTLSTGVDATDLAASLDIPVDFMWYAIHKLKAHIFRVRRKREDADYCEAQGEEELLKALNYDGLKTTPQGLYTSFD